MMNERDVIILRIIADGSQQWANGIESNPERTIGSQHQMILRAAWGFFSGRRVNHAKNPGADINGLAYF
jgi:hypothetical protein